MGKNRIISPADAFALFGGLADEAGERLSAACVDAGGEVLTLWRAAPGSISLCSVVMPVTELLRQAVSCGAWGLIVAHNHPGGDPGPSLQDVRATRRLAERADALGVRLLDHVIVAAGACESFRLMGLL